MAGHKHLIVFAYDIQRDSLRNRIATILEQRGVRVQYSVFECRMTVEAAEILLSKMDLLRETGDSIRMYVIPEDGRRRSRAAGGAPISAAEDYYLL
jgi:CRISPR-associated protein Cas2